MEKNLFFMLKNLMSRVFVVMSTFNGIIGFVCIHGPEFLLMENGGAESSLLDTRDKPFKCMCGASFTRRMSCTEAQESQAVPRQALSN